ncbi:MAG TPA: DUF3224 domain-containing protein [Myxococcota bacterium]|jgi:hypothetical protein
MQAKGTFDTKATPDTTSFDTDAPTGGPTLGRMIIDKTFAGDFVGRGRVWMTTAMTSTQGSAGYVALERMTGSLHGKSGSFIMQHSGTMNRGAQTLSVTVVPDSGAGELTTIAGTLLIEIVDGQHYYTFDYAL